MKKNKLLWLLTCLVLLTSCGGDGDEPTTIVTPPPAPTPSDPTPSSGGGKDFVTFTPSLNGITRATETAFEQGDRISVYAMKAATGDTRAIIADNGNYANNVLYTHANGKFTSNSAIVLPESGKLFYIAVYPYSSQVANRFNFAVNTNQSSAAAFTGSDLCTASTDATDAKEVPLKFDHRLTELIINLTGDGWTSSNITVRVVNVLTHADVNLNDLSFTATGSRADVVCAPNGTNSYKAILPPQTIASGNTMLVVNMNGTDYPLATQNNLEFRSGKKYEYTLNMNQNNEIVEFTGDINPWQIDERINSVIPEDIQKKMEPYIPIYRGNTPPNIEGTVYVDPFTAVYCEDYPDNGGYAPGRQVNSEYIRFSNQNMVYNTLDIDTRSVAGTETQTGSGAFISGSGNNFTAYFNTVGQSSGIYTRTALLISGTKTSSGIADLKYAFVMVEKGSDPTHILMNEGVFRIFEDQDGLSTYTSWPGSSAPQRVAALQPKWTVYSNNR